MGSDFIPGRVHQHSLEWPGGAKKIAFLVEKGGGTPRRSGFPKKSRCDSFLFDAIEFKKKKKINKNKNKKNMLSNARQLGPSFKFAENILCSHRKLYPLPMHEKKSGFSDFPRF